jgi:GTPase SAR1 family protein
MRALTRRRRRRRSRETYNHLVSWLTDARTLARQDITVCVVGNKCDKKGAREVTLLEASRFAQENDCLFMETSAATGECVDEVFLKLAASVLGKVETGAVKIDAPLGARDDEAFTPGADEEAGGGGGGGACGC